MYSPKRTVSTWIYVFLLKDYIVYVYKYREIYSPKLTGWTWPIHLLFPRFKLDVFHYSAAMTAFENCETWITSLALLSEARRESIVANEYMCLETGWSWWAKVEKGRQGWWDWSWWKLMWKVVVDHSHWKFEWVDNCIDLRWFEFNDRIFQEFKPQFRLVSESNLMIHWNFPSCSQTNFPSEKNIKDPTISITVWLQEFSFSTPDIYHTRILSRWSDAQMSWQGYVPNSTPALIKIGPS